MHPKDAVGMANNVDPESRSSLIWVCTVWPGLSVRKLRNITVIVICHFPSYDPRLISRIVIFVIKMWLVLSFMSDLQFCHYCQW